MPKKINIAIDGFSSCGKGTLAKQLAKSLNYLFIDTGAMYRAVTLAMLEKRVDIDDMEGIGELLKEVDIHFIHRPEDNFYHTTLNGRDVEEEIRSMEISNLVSPVSKIDIVRSYLVEQQRKIGESKGVVMDGRDIGTVVFPKAELKIFMTAKPEIRARRRFEELRRNGDELVTFEDVLANLNSRDLQDSNRANSPLKPANDARVLDNSFLTRDEQFHIALEWALEIIG